MLIRRLNCFDYRKIKRLVRYLAQDDSEKFAKSIMEEPLGIINALLPIKLKFKSESYILIFFTVKKSYSCLLLGGEKYHLD